MGVPVAGNYAVAVFAGVGRIREMARTFTKVFLVLAFHNINLRAQARDHELADRLAWQRRRLFRGTRSGCRHDRRSLCSLNDKVARRFHLPETRPQKLTAAQEQEYCTSGEQYVRRESF